MNHDNYANLFEFKASKKYSLKTLQTNNEDNINLILSSLSSKSILNLNPQEKSLNIQVNSTNDVIKFKEDRIISNMDHYINNSIIDTLTINSALFTNNININNIKPINTNYGISDDDITYDKILNLYGKIINIGDLNSIVNIQGRTNFRHTTDLIIKDKVIRLNYNDNDIPNDIGSNSGIIIGGNYAGDQNNIGYIKTSDDAKRFLIKPPLGPSEFVTTQDINNNIYISGKSILNNLDVYGKSNIYNDITIYSILNATNILINNLSINSKLNIIGNTNIQGNLNINANTIIYNNINIENNTFIKGNTFITGNTNLYGNAYITGNSYISGNSIIYGNSYITGNSIIYGNSIINGNTNINGNISISGKTLINANFGCKSISKQFGLNQNTVKSYI